jgi:hypothetical protein
MVHIESERPAIQEPTVLDAHVISLEDAAAAAAHTTVFRPGLSVPEASQPRPLTIRAERDELPTLAALVEGMAHPDLAAELRHRAALVDEGDAIYGSGSTTEPLTIQGLPAQQLKGLMPFIAGVEYRVVGTTGDQPVLDTVAPELQVVPGEAPTDILRRRLGVVYEAENTGSFVVPDTGALAELGFKGGYIEKDPMTPQRFVRGVGEIHVRHSKHLKKVLGEVASGVAPSRVKRVFSGVARAGVRKTVAAARTATYRSPGK